MIRALLAVAAFAALLVAVLAVLATAGPFVLLAARGREDLDMRGLVSATVLAVVVLLVIAGWIGGGGCG